MKKIYFILSFICIANLCFAQLGLIDYGNGNHIINFPDTVVNGSSVDSAYVTVVNNSTTLTFTGAITLNIYLDTTGSGNPSIFLKTKVEPGNNIPPLGTKNIMLDSVDIIVTPFKYGNGNVVVV